MKEQLNSLALLTNVIFCTCNHAECKQVSDRALASVGKMQIIVKPIERRTSQFTDFYAFLPFIPFYRKQKHHTSRQQGCLTQPSCEGTSFSNTMME